MNATNIKAFLLNKEQNMDGLFSLPLFNLDLEPLGQGTQPSRKRKEKKTLFA